MLQGPSSSWPVMATLRAPQDRVRWEFALYVLGVAGSLTCQMARGAAPGTRRRRQANRDGR